MTVKELLEFYRYLDKRGFLREDLQCDPEHQVETYLRDFCKDNKPTGEQYVDLGLPSGTLWATRNVGADSPEEYGDYFTWGEAMKLDCTLPTKEQALELIRECSSVWTKQNGVNGCLFTGPNGNTLFLPAAGGYYVNESLYDEYSRGYYWLSSLIGDTSHNACYLTFDSISVCWDNGYRYNGQSVRAVKKKENDS